MADASPAPPGREAPLAAVRAAQKVHFYSKDQHIQKDPHSQQDHGRFPADGGSSLTNNAQCPKNPGAPDHNQADPSPPDPEGSASLFPQPFLIPISLPLPFFFNLSIS